MTQGSAEATGYEMDTEIAVDSTGPGHREYVEVGVEEGDNIVDLYFEGFDDGEVTGGKLRLGADELDALIAALGKARETIRNNS
jgi:hypothetical protein